MTHMQRWEVALVNASGSGYRTRQSETGEWVRFADAEAAIAAAEQRERQVVIVGQETHDAVKELCREAWQQGERAMLAKCIAAVDGLGTYGIDSSPNLGDALAALRALGDSDE